MSSEQSPKDNPRGLCNMVQFVMLYVVEFSKPSQPLSSRVKTSSGKTMASSPPSLFESAFQPRKQPKNRKIGIVHLSDEDVGCLLFSLTA